jgi:hypothetical protein
MKLLIPNAFLMSAAVLTAYVPMREIPQRVARPPVIVELSMEPVRLPRQSPPLRVAGAWRLTAADRRLFGLSGLTFDGNGFVAVGDAGSVVRFDRPGPGARMWLTDLRDGPGPFGRRWTRDAEAVLRDGDGWLVAYEQKHSLWRFDRDFRTGREVAAIGKADWPDNRGAEGLSCEGGAVLAWRESGQEVRVIEGDGVRSMSLSSGWAVAEAADAPDGATWLLLRRIGMSGIDQAVAPARRERGGYALGPVLPLAKGRFDNFEGMAIERAPSGGLRFWMLSDDGSRLFARTLLAAYDLPKETNARR